MDAGPESSYLYLNHWSIIGVVVSGVGLALAFIQIRRVRKTTDAINATYKSAIHAVENREVISTISTLLQRVESLKTMIREGRGQEMAHDVSTIAKLIVAVQGSLGASGQSIDLLPFRDLCNELEVRTLSENGDGLQRNQLANQFLQLSRLEQMLTEIQSRFKYGAEHNTPGTS